MVAEGVRTTASAIRLARGAAIPMPICEEVGAVLFDAKPVRQALEALLARDPRSEEEVPVLALSPAPGPRGGALGDHLDRAGAAALGLSRDALAAEGRPMRLLCGAGVANARRGVGAPNRREPTERAGLARSRGAQQVPGAAHRGRLEPGRGGALRPDERGRRPRGRHRVARACCGHECRPCRTWWRCSWPIRHGSATLATTRDSLRDDLQEPRRCRRRHADHTHCQFIATPIVPSMIEEELAGALQHFRIKQRCIWCDIVRQERRDGLRMIPRKPVASWRSPRSRRAFRSRPVPPRGRPVELRGHAGGGPGRAGGPPRRRSRGPWRAT